MLVLVAEVAGHVVQGHGDVFGGGAVRQSAVERVSRRRRDLIVERPEARDHVAESGQLERRGEVEGLVRVSYPMVGCGARGKVGQFRVGEPEPADLR